MILLRVSHAICNEERESSEHVTHHTTNCTSHSSNVTQIVLVHPFDNCTQLYISSQYNYSLDTDSLVDLKKLLIVSFWVGLEPVAKVFVVAIDNEFLKQT